MAAAPGSPRRLGTFVDGLSPARHGALIFVAAGLVFIATDSLTKTLVSHLPVVHVVFGRHISYLVAILVLAGGRRPRRLLATKRPWTQLARGLAMFATTATFFFSLSLLPMAEVSALGSTTPLMVLVLAGPLLGEHVRRIAVAGAVIGFTGVVVLVGIDPANLDPAVLMPLLSALSLAVFGLLTRELRNEPTDVTVFCSGLVGMAAAAAFEVVIPTTTMPSPVEWGGIALVGLMALAGHRLLVMAYQWGRASDLAPLSYLSVLWSFVAGTLLFGEPLQARAIAGAMAIAAGGVMTLHGSPADGAEVASRTDQVGPMDREAS